MGLLYDIKIPIPALLANTMATLHTIIDPLPFTRTDDYLSPNSCNFHLLYDILIQNSCEVAIICFKKLLQLLQEIVTTSARNCYNLCKTLLRLLAATKTAVFVHFIFLSCISLLIATALFL